MRLCLSTRWNAYRHAAGETMIEEILALGLRRVELGYDLTYGLLPGVRRMVDSRAVVVDSVHNFCPVPATSLHAHPEVFTLCSRWGRVRENAARYTAQTIRFAAEIGAGVVVMHAGAVSMRNFSGVLLRLAHEGRQQTPAFDRTRMKLLAVRDRRAPPHLERLCLGLEQLMPVLQDARIRLGIEITPAWEGVPDETEMEWLTHRFDPQWIGYWHDMGHSQIRENLGLVSHLRWLRRALPFTFGIHVHDVVPPAYDHLMPPQGNIDFALFRFLAEQDIPLVLEPGPGVSGDSVEGAVRLLERLWAAAPEAPAEALAATKETHA